MDDLNYAMTYFDEARGHFCQRRWHIRFTPTNQVGGRIVIFEWALLFLARNNRAKISRSMYTVWF